ncbi:DUF5606 family protein [Thermophagus xiamenensis]|uniref:Uncharacterized protein n=1 Tax=Thermophagus xiamenensis TaxID=385682 RepID=A0A1I1VW77_9BACT|nr:DUF5606 domain-containing protein [Thermophagus xiamenensis]SFD84860.1 hypothetical protein SAMN05444380_1031 [Thermophagus xiamenensis]
MSMLKGILAISGKPGLFKLITNAKNSIIVESLLDGKRMPAYATSKISSLEDISIYTIDDDVKLADVFISIFEKDVKINPKKASSDELKKTFKEVLPDYDDERVYVSDIKKVFTWFNLLKEKGIISQESIEEYNKAKESEEVDEEKENSNNE